MAPEPPPFRLRDVVVWPQRHLLEVAGERRRLEPRVMRLLLVLAAGAGEVRSRRELLDEVWEAAFVEEEALTQAVSVLRKALGDERRRPRFVETIPKGGYRLVPRPEPLAPAAAVPAATPARRPRRLGRIAALLAVGGAAGVVVGLQGRSMPPAPLEARPLTSWVGRESEPAVAPDGNRVAFVRSGAAAAENGIYVQSLGGGDPRRLVGGAGFAASPAWSPDGRRIAFARVAAGGCSLAVVEVASGRERVLAPCAPAAQPYLAWVPGGRHLVVAERDAGLDRFRLSRVPLDGGSWRRLTTPPPGLGDRFPAVSPDGALVAFSRTTVLGAADLWLLPVNGGAPQRLTTDGDAITGITWAADGRTILYGADRGAGFALWEIDREGGRPRWLPLAGGEEQRPSAAAAALVFERPRFRSQIWRLAPGGRPRPLLSSTRWDEQPALSPDGRRVAFVSNRNGRSEAWMAARDGSALRRLSALGAGRMAALRWSPDGRRLALSARHGDQSDLFVIDTARGITVRIAASAADNELVPAWSADGRRLFFLSDRDGRWRIWSVGAGGGAPSPLAEARASSLWAAPDGTHLYFSRFDRDGIWRLRTDGGRDIMLVEPRLDRGDFAHWGLSGGRLFLAVRGPAGTARVLLLDPQARRERWLGEAPVGFDDLGLAVAPDGELLYARGDRSESDLYWVPRAARR